MGFSKLLLGLSKLGSNSLTLVLECCLVAEFFVLSF